MIERRITHRLLLTLSAALVLPGCSVPAQPTSPPATAEAATPTKEMPKMHASPAPEALPLPSLAEVHDEQGNAINRDDVLGHWTVLWFYPAAATPG